MLSLLLLALAIPVIWPYIAGALGITGTAAAASQADPQTLENTWNNIKERARNAWRVGSTTALALGTHAVNTLNPNHLLSDPAGLSESRVLQAAAAGSRSGGSPSGAGTGSSSAGTGAPTRGGAPAGRNGNNRGGNNRRRGNNNRRLNPLPQPQPQRPGIGLRVSNAWSELRGKPVSNANSNTPGTPPPDGGKKIWPWVLGTAAAATGVNYLFNNGIEIKGNNDRIRKEILQELEKEKAFNAGVPASEATEGAPAVEENDSTRAAKYGF